MLWVRVAVGKQPLVELLLYFSDRRGAPSSTGVRTRGTCEGRLREAENQATVGLPGSLFLLESCEECLQNSSGSYQSSCEKGAGDEVKRKVVELLERVGLTPPEYFLNKYPHRLSGGMRRRLSIARALLSEPELLVADEPVSIIDPSLRVSSLDMLKDLSTKFRSLATLHRPRAGDDPVSCFDF